MTSEPTVMTNSVSRGTPSSRRRADDDVAQAPVADVDDARPQDPVRVDAERVLVVEAVVEERAGQVVRGADRVDVAGQVEVEVLHRDDLAVAAAGGAALDPEHRPERRLADVDRRLLADVVEALGEPDRGRRLALAERRRRDRGDEDVLAARALGLEPPDALERDLGLRRAVELELVVGDAQLARDVDDRARRDERAISRSDGKLIGLLGRRDAAGGRASARRACGVAPAARRRTRWVSSSALVSGPTPPGTGVIAEATSAAESKSTSPTILPSTTLMPTSTTTAPA
jgi:hypothetical protein